ncbi:hypothetical protein C8R44DRAFT_755084 [Mycena epipterygia]|nr:hypothetical protein C8R44DRAFT_755084 [Mycena epipterygia]
MPGVSFGPYSSHSEDVYERQRHREREQEERERELKIQRAVQEAEWVAKQVDEDARRKVEAAAEKEAQLRRQQTETERWISDQRGPSPSKTVLNRGECAKCVECTQIAVKAGIVFAPTPMLNGATHGLSYPSEICLWSLPADTKSESSAGCNVCTLVVRMAFEANLKRVRPEIYDVLDQGSVLP